MAASRHLLDAGPLVAFLDRSDRDHAWSRGILGKLPPPLLTCEAVLSEALFLLRADPDAPMKIGTLIERHLLLVPPVLECHAAEVFALMHTYRNVPMSLADACLVRLSEKLPTAKIVTLDSDFRIYRRHRRQAIPLLIPKR